jgi:hypothetical protein
MFTEDCFLTETGLHVDDISLKAIQALSVTEKLADGKLGM